MSQSNYNIPNESAPNVRAQLNAVFGSIAMNNSGSAAPSTTFAYQWWYDTSTDLLKMRNGANSAWIDIAYLDQSASAFRLLDDTQVTDTSGVQTGLLGGQPTADWEAGTGTTESLVSPAKVKAAVAPLRAPDAHFAGAHSSSTGTLPLAVTLRNVISSEAVLASDRFTLQPGDYYIESTAEVFLSTGIGSDASASIVLRDVTNAANLVRVALARGNTKGNGRSGSAGFYVSPGSATAYELNFARGNSNWTTGPTAFPSAHSGVTDYPQQVRVWKLA